MTRLFSSSIPMTDSQLSELEANIKAQGDTIRQLKADGVDKATLAPYIETLVALKAQLPTASEDLTAAVSKETKQQPQQKQQRQRPVDDESQMTESEIRKTRLAKVQAMRDANIEPYAYKFEPSHTAGQLQALYEGRLEGGQEDVDFGDVTVAGRIMVKRNFGKLAFYTMQDESGMIQLHLEQKRLGDTFEVSEKQKR